MARFSAHRLRPAAVVRAIQMAARRQGGKVITRIGGWRHGKMAGFGEARSLGVRGLEAPAG